MSCACSCNPCVCDAADEPMSSVLTNLVTTMIGTPSKSCVNNVVVWVLPCDLDAGIPSFPKNAGESIACYFLRFMEQSSVGSSTGSKGYETTALTNANDTLVAHVDVQDQDYTGTLTGPVSIILSSSGASEGDHFYISTTGLVIGAVNTLTIQSDATVLFVFNTAGTLNGYIKAVYTGTEWKLTTITENLS